MGWDFFLAGPDGSWIREHVFCISLEAVDGLSLGERHCSGEMLFDGSEVVISALFRCDYVVFRFYFITCFYFS